MTARQTTATAAVLISGGGSNLQSLIDATGARRIPLEISVVVSNVANAGGIERARRAGIAAEVVDNLSYPDRPAFERALAGAIDRYRPDMLILAGFMRILTPEFVARYDGRILNIHPSLLPKYPGLNTHRRALEARESWHGCTVHFVTADLDGGPPVIQGRVPVRASDTTATLAARVLKVEHQIYPIAAGLLARGRIRCEGGAVLLDERSLSEPLQFDPEKKGPDTISA